LKKNTKALFETEQISIESKEKLREIDTELSQLSLTFGEHVLADTQAFQLHIEKEEDLKGLPLP